MRSAANPPHGGLRRPLPLLLCVVAVGLAACPSDTTSPQVAGPTRVQLQSDAGDYIGDGKSYEYTQQDAVISVYAEGNQFWTAVDGDEQWTGDFRMPGGTSRLAPGEYTSLRWWGEGRACTTYTGWFAIDKVTYLGDELTAIEIRFRQHCGGAAAALHGSIRWRADDTTQPPGPVQPIPAGLWQPPPGSVPAAGNFVYLSSQNGDYIGQGLTYTYTPANATIAATADGGNLRIVVDATEWWAGDFQAMSSLTRLEPGYYSDLRRYPFHNPAKGGMEWYGEGRGCNTLVGWFAIDRVVYAGLALAAVELRLEQHCDGETPALRAALRWEADP